MFSGDTIAAVSSGVGAAARMIVRASGPDAARIASEICAIEPERSKSIRSHVEVNGLRFPLELLWFPAGRSATGEDTIEFHLPGNALLARKLLDELVRRGARHAEPGEFTARGYFNGRMDLSQAEGVAATIAARNDRQLFAARQLLSGELARRLSPIMERLAETLALVEVGIDFTEEDVTFLTDEQVAARIGEIEASLAELLTNSRRFDTMSAEVTVALVGRPNAGKSTLLNALAGMDRAVISPVAGTTRDALSADVRLPSGTVRMIDVAGLDAAADLRDASPESQICRQMRDTALRTVESSDLVVLVSDASSSDPPPELHRPPDLTVINKLDLIDAATVDCGKTLAVSAKTGQGLDALRRRLDRLAFGIVEPAASLVLTARHVEAVEAARRSLAQASSSLSAGQEMLALDLRDALDSLGLILGTVSPDELLGKIFSNFCIGK